MNVTADGNYNFDFRVASAGQGGSFHLESDGAIKSNAITIINTSTWATWKDVVVNGVQLSAGQHTLKLAFDALGANKYAGNLNYFTVTPANLPPPPPPVSTAYPSGTPPLIAATGSTTIQLENFDNGGENLAYHDTDTANLGGQYRSTGVDLGTATDGGPAVALGYVKKGEWLEIHRQPRRCRQLLPRLPRRLGGHRRLFPR